MMKPEHRTKTYIQRNHLKLGVTLHCTVCICMYRQAEAVAACTTWEQQYTAYEAL